MTFDAHTLLTETELTTPRTPKELAQWLDEKLRYLADHKEARRWVLLHEGLSKNLHEEIYPLSLFATHYYGERANIQCIYRLDHADFDALILDSSISPPSELKVEITWAVDGYDHHLRMKYFMEHGHVYLWSPLVASGTKNKGHQISHELVMVDHSDLLARVCELIRTAVERKSIKANGPEKYGLGHVLVVAFDDWSFFDPERDRSVIEPFVERLLAETKINFGALFVVGLSGKTFLHYQLGGL